MVNRENTRLDAVLVIEMSANFVIAPRSVSPATVLPTIELPPLGLIRIRLVPEVPYRRLLEP